ncbi:MAG: hypothetical protein ABW072_02240 [Sedimenticola sp.]
MTSKRKHRAEARVIRKEKELAEAKAECRRIDALDKEVARKQRNHRLTLWGVVVEQAMKAGDIDKADFDQLISTHLKNERERMAAAVPQGHIQNYSRGAE